MNLLELTLPTPAENLALDEALLEAAEAGETAADLLRLWELPQTAVIVGRSTRVNEEVNLDAAQLAQVPIVRRASGGAAIAAGPGCLMYSVLLRYEGREYLRKLDEVHRDVLGRIRTALSSHFEGIEHRGTSDLAVGDRKFSGNSLRCRRDHLLYHGTILYNYDLALIAHLLKTPPRQPIYRHHRPHSDFVTNLPISQSTLRSAFITAFGAVQTMNDWPKAQTDHLLLTRYSQAAWNFSR